MVIAPARPSGAARLARDLRARFAAERAQRLRAVVELRVGNRPPDIERFQLVIADGRCDLAERPLPPTTIIEVDPEDLADLLGGRTKVAQLFMSQRLRVRGDMLLAARLPGLFPGVG